MSMGGEDDKTTIEDIGAHLYIYVCILTDSVFRKLTVGVK